MLLLLLLFFFLFVSFLCDLGFKNYRNDITALLKGTCFLTIRQRLACRIRIAKTTKQEATSDEAQAPAMDQVYRVLNEVVIDRGPSPYLCNLECYCDNHLVTNIQADG
jgi:NAD+ kinase